MIELFQGNAIDILTRDLGVFDGVISDPPYASGSTLAGEQQSTAIKYTDAKKHCPYPDFVGDGMDQRAWGNMMRQVLELCRSKCRQGAVLALFVDWRNLPVLMDAMQWAGWLIRGLVVWDKLSSRLQRGRFCQQAEFVVWGSNGMLPFDRGVPCLPGVFRAANVQPNIRIHQTQNPLEVMRDICKIVVPGGRILDPFAGSGSTLIAAREEGHPAVGIEASPEIARTAAERCGVEVLT